MTRSIQILIFCFCCLLSGKLFANEEWEKTGAEDLGLATVWGIGQVTQGGYLLPGIEAAMIDKDINFLLNLEGGWRFTSFLKLGFYLGGTINKISTQSSRGTYVGPVIAFDGDRIKLPTVNFKLTCGALYLNDTDHNSVFCAPAIETISRKSILSGKPILWASHLTVRITDQTESSSLNSLSMGVGIALGAY